MFNDNFLTDESGAVTVDWVVLTASLVGLGLAVMAVISQGLQSVTGDLGTQMSDGTIIRTAFNGSVIGDATSACAAVDATCAHTYAAADLPGLGKSALATEVAAFNAGGFSSVRDFDGDADVGYTYAAGSTLGTAGDAVSGSDLATARANDAYEAALASEVASRVN